MFIGKVLILKEKAPDLLRGFITNLYIQYSGLGEIVCHMDVIDSVWDMRFGA